MINRKKIGQSFLVWEKSTLEVYLDYPDTPPKDLEINPLRSSAYKRFKDRKVEHSDFVPKYN